MFKLNHLPMSYEVRNFKDELTITSLFTKQLTKDLILTKLYNGEDYNILYS